MARGQQTRLTRLSRRLTVLIADATTFAFDFGSIRAYARHPFAWLWWAIPMLGPTVFKEIYYDHQWSNQHRIGSASNFRSAATNVD